MIHKLLKSNGERVEGTASHLRGALICLLVSASTVAMDGFARATLWTCQSVPQQYNYNVNGVPVATVRVQLRL